MWTYCYTHLINILGKSVRVVLSYRMKSPNWKRHFRGFQYRRLTKTTLGGLPEYNSTYASFTPTFSSIYPERSIHIGAIEGDKLFILTYKTTPNEYDKYMPIVRQMIDTFQISNSTKSNRHHITCKQVIVAAHILRMFQPYSWFISLSLSSRVKPCCFSYWWTRR
jgi:hypothetical protein